MVKIFCDNINKEILDVANSIAERQNDTVQLITPYGTLEVHHEKEEKAQENQKDKN